MSDQDGGQRRSRRQVSSKAKSASQALEELKKLKGKKHKYELKEEEPVYDVVDEEEYTNRVVKRLKDDWIEDDAIGGYYEDGREIFDEDDEDEEEDYDDEVSGDRKSAKNKKKRIRRKPASEALKEEEPAGPKNYDLLAMFQKISENAGKKPKKKEVENIVDDQYLDKLIDECVPGIANGPSLAPKPLPKSSTQPLKLKKLSSSTSALRKAQEAGSKTSNLKRKPVLAECIPDIDDFDEPPTKKLSFDKFDAVIQDENGKKDVKKKAPVKIDVGWNATEEEGTDGSPAAETTEIETEEKESSSSDDFVKIFWLDVYESPNIPGTVYVFGKVTDPATKKYVSCCLHVNNIERQLFLLPRETLKSDPESSVTTDDVYTEFNSMKKKFKISSFKSKKTVKKYAFDRQGVPNESAYLEVLVPPTVQVPSDLEGDTFSCVFGSHQSFLERLLLDRKMKGPGWLQVNKPRVVEQPHSWCKVEWSVDSMKHLTVLDKELSPRPPVLNVMSLSVKTLMNHSTKNNEIFAVSAFLEDSFNIESGCSTKGLNKSFQNHFCAITKPSQSFNIIFPLGVTPSTARKEFKTTSVEIQGSERELLNFLMAKIQTFDPDIIMGHDIHDFDLEVLLQRLTYFKVATWSKIGRLRRMNTQPSLKKRDRMSATCGRIVADLKISAKELIRVKTYDLNELCKTIFKSDEKERPKNRRDERQEFSQDIILNCYNSKEELQQLINWIMRDNWLIYQMILELKVLPLALQITRIAGNSFSRTLLGGRAERNEFLLLHAFSEDNYIIPDKQVFDNLKNSKWKNQNVDEDGEEQTEDTKNLVGRKKAAYAGGLVLEPKVGFYTEFILILDFNSLYPSIMREYNICFTTINLRTYKPSSDDDVPNIPEGGLPPGILPTEITRLIESRREVKKQLQDPKLTVDQKTQLDIQQKALKLTANSMYGCLGFGNSRFYARPLAALITFKGREILMKTKNLVEALGYEVIYGDTDSIMINTKSIDLTEAYKICSKVRSAVNASYKYLEIDCDAVLKTMLLLKKKKYAALIVEKAGDKVNYKKEMKGLDIVRRDWSNIAVQAGETVIDHILALDVTPERVVDNIHEYLRSLTESLRRPIEHMSRADYVKQFIIHKSLTKNPEDYGDSKNLSHVLVALNYNETSQKKLRVGDVVPYVVCLKPSDPNFSLLPATQRVLHASHVIEDQEYQIDINYYLSQQIHPVVSRLCEPLAGTDARSIAEFLGLDCSFVPRKATNAIDVMISAGKNRFDVCHPLILTCPSCHESFETTQPLNEGGTWSLSKCPKCSVSFEKEENSLFIERHFKLALNRFVNRFYSFWMTCEDSMCGLKMRLCTGPVLRKGPQCPSCSSTLIMDYPSSQMNLQLSFFEFICDNPSKKDTSSQLQEIPEVSNKDKDKITLVRKCLDGISLRNIPLHERLLGLVREVKDLMCYNEVDVPSIIDKYATYKTIHKNIERLQST